MTELACTICDRMKSATSELHRAAESHAFQQTLMRGELPRRNYVNYLLQMLLVHRALEDALRASAQRHPAIERVMRDEYYRESHLLRDLEFYEAEASDARPSTACGDLVQRIRAAGEERPAALLGFLYVLEGSTNGAKFIAKAVQQAYELPSGQGIAFLDPHGDRQRELWMRFRRDVEAAGLNEAGVETMIDAARTMFESIRFLFDDLMETAQTSALAVESSMKDLMKRSESTIEMGGRV